MLAAKGHPYSPTPPYFSNTNWGVGQEGANTMGAAFNYVMLLYDNGAYAHNSAYAKQLIFDSIDYLYNGSVTGSIEAALSYLVANEQNYPGSRQQCESLQGRDQLHDLPFVFLRGATPPT